VLREGVKGGRAVWREEGDERMRGRERKRERRGGGREIGRAE
jgi:hypothetical protein